MTLCTAREKYRSPRPANLKETNQKPSDRGQYICFAQSTKYSVEGRRTQRSEKPPVLAAVVAVLKDLLDGLLGLLTLAGLLEGVGVDDSLEALKLKGIASGHQVVVVDDLNERLDLAALLDPSLRHAAGDLAGVPLDARNKGVAVGVALGALVDGLDDHNLEKY
mgnify:FL=1